MSEPALNPQQTVALAGVIPSKDVSAAKGGLTPETVEAVRFQVLVDAMVKKSAGTTAKPTASLLNKATVAFLCRRLGATRAKVEKALADLVEVAIANGGKVGDDLVADDDELLLAIHRLEQHVIDRLPKVERPGRVTVTGKATPLAIEADAADAPIRLEATAEVQIEAAVEGEAPKPPTFAMVAYTGGAMRLAGWRFPVVVDLEGMAINSQSRPVRYQHDARAGVGHTTRIEIRNHQLHAQGIISRQTDAAREIIASGKSGFPWQASIGARPDSVEFVAAGRTVTVNNRQFSGPLNIARKTTLGEISFVDLGGDEHTSVNIAAEAAATEERAMFEQWLKAKGFDPSNLSDDQKAILKAAWQAEQSDTNDGGGEGGSDGGRNQAGHVEASGSTSGEGDLDQVLETATREARRRQRITEVSQQLLAQRPDLADHVGQLARTAIEAGTAANQFELDVLRLNRGHGGIHVRQDDSRDGRTTEAAMCLAGGLAEPEKHFAERTLEAADRHYGRALGLVETLLMFAQANGYRGHGASNLSSMLRCAFEAGSIQAASASTLSLPGILSNTANKFLRAGFDSVESTWRAIAAIRPVRDFKQVTSYSLTGGFKYEKVGPSGELKHGTVGEQSYTNQAETYGKMFAITRTDLINDDLGALTAVPRRLGRGGALKLNDVFWTEFMDNGSFFTAGNRNYKTGATTALGIDALSTAEQVFFDQVDPDGNPLGVMPAILLVPNGLNALASALMRSTKIVTAGGSSKAKDPDENPHSGKFSIARSSYLSNTNITGNSSKAWYLLADPEDMPAIEVAFLNGRQEPTVESADADFNSLGIQMRGYHDFGVAKQEPRGGVKMKGEA